jgi:hypothetical protein
MNNNADGNKEASEPSSSSPPKRSFAAAMEEVEARQDDRESRAFEKEFLNALRDFDYGIRRTSNGTWYRKTRRGWDKVTREDIATHLIRQGVSSRYGKEDELSGVDLVMDNCIDYWMVDYAQEIAGYIAPGQYAIGNKIALVTRGASFIELKQGTEEDFLDLYLFFKHAFTEPLQFDAWLGWLEQAVRVLRTAVPPAWAHGLALLLIGDPGIGKTSLQHLITLALAGRATDPKIFFKGDSTFNSQLAENEHWMMADPGHKGTKAERDSFLSNLKESVANVWMGCHPKGEKEITIPTYRRSSISLNPDKMALAILQGMEPGTLEKTLILDFKDAGKYRPDGPGGMRYGEWHERMVAQLPYFLYWLLNVYTVPEALRDSRYGVRYTNPAMESRLAATTIVEDETEVKEIVGIGVFTNIKPGSDEVLNETGPLTIGEIIDRITHTRSPVNGRARQHPDYFYNPNHTRFGNLLSKWSESEPAGEPVFHDIPPFSITRHTTGEGKSRKSRYSFTREAGDDFAVTPTPKTKEEVKRWIAARAKKD